MAAAKNFNEYSARFPMRIQHRLEQMRRAIRAAAAKAEETISYGIPAFKLNGILVWFAAFRNHIGFYPRAEAIAAFQRDLSPYKSSKGAVQFPHGDPLPLSPVSRIVRFRVAQILRKKK